MLTRLRAAIQGGLPVPSDVAAWLEQGLDKFEASGGRLALCVALSLRGAGIVSLETARARQRRDEALLSAYALSDPTASDWRRCEIVAGVVSKFSRSWPRTPATAADAALFDAIKAAFSEASASGLLVPRTASGILARVRVARGHHEFGGGGHSRKPPAILKAENMQSTDDEQEKT